MSKRLACGSSPSSYKLFKTKRIPALVDVVEAATSKAEATECQIEMAECEAKEAISVKDEPRRRTLGWNDLECCKLLFHLNSHLRLAGWRPIQP
jgi:hypothetical protein